MSLSTHVLDAMAGRPAEGVAVRLEERIDGDWHTTAEGSTDADGRIGALGSPGAGTHRLHFDTGAYFGAAGVATFYPEVTVTFTVVDASAHHHVPLLLSPFAFSTYRGS
ncbi:MAG TPA: hydroxyisourate hydrolase [Solirubrobacteraceae bacterium]|nr:hydroxyisourate hydrolase [Solirubrobacteraceae bacterium]